MQLVYIFAALAAFFGGLQIFIILAQNEIESKDVADFYDPKNEDNFLF